MDKCVLYAQPEHIPNLHICHPYNREFGLVKLCPLIELKQCVWLRMIIKWRERLRGEKGVRECVPEPAPSNQINFYPKRKLSPYLSWNGPKRKTIGVTDEMDCMGSFYLSWNSHRFRGIYIYIFPFSVMLKLVRLGFEAGLYSLESWLRN